MAYVELEAARKPIPESRSKITQRETNWGLVVSERPVNKKFFETVETTLRVFGLLIVLGSGVIPFLKLPATMTVGFALAFVFVGFSLFRYASNGFLSELRIDTRFGGVRIGMVNASGDFSEKRAFPRSEVESFFIQRSDTKPAKLCLRLKSKPQPIVLLRGSEDELLRPFERIVEALFVKKGSGKRVTTRANGGFIHATYD